MAFDNNDFDFDAEPEQPAPAAEEPSNRPFWIVAGALGGLFLLTLICLIGFLVARPLILGGNGNNNGFVEATANAINTQNAIMEGTATAARMIAQWTPTPSPTLKPSATLANPSATPVLAQPPSATPLDMVNSRTATVSALLTLAATSQKATPTATPLGGGGTIPTSTALPDSGLADNVGIPGMLALAVILVGVIFLTRRLRS